MQGAAAETRYERGFPTNLACERRLREPSRPDRGKRAGEDDENEVIEKEGEGENRPRSAMRLCRAPHDSHSSTTKLSPRDRRAAHDVKPMATEGKWTTHLLARKPG